MSKKVLIISKEYTPIPNGTVVCLENALPIIGSAHKIILFTARVRRNDKNYETINNVTIVRPDNRYDNAVVLMNCILQKISAVKFDYKVKLFLNKIIRILFMPFSILAKKKGLFYNKYSEAALVSYIGVNINLLAFDVIVSFGAPFINTRVACQLKKMYPDLKLITVLFDLYSYSPVYLSNDIPGDNGFQSRLNEELEWFRISDSIVITNEMKDVISKTDLWEMGEKIFIVSMPSLRDMSHFDSSSYVKKNIDDSIYVAYTGVLYEDLRNPRFTVSDKWRCQFSKKFRLFCGFRRIHLLPGWG